MDISLIAPFQPPVINAFKSSAQIDVSTRKFYHRLSAPSLAFTPATDPKDSPIQFLNWMSKALEKYGGISVGIKNEYLPEDRTTKTMSSQAGFDITGHYNNNIHADQKGQLLDRWRQHHSPKNAVSPFLYSREVNYYGMRSEWLFMSALQSVDQKHLYDVRDWHAFNRLWDSEELRLREIDETIIFEKRRIFVDWKYKNYQILMDNDPGRS